MYLIALLSSFFPAVFIAEYKSSIKWSFTYKVLFLVFVVLAGFRYRVGTDTVGYEYVFDSIDTGISLDYDALLSAGEPLWYFINYVFKYFGLSWFVLQFAISAIINFSYFDFFHKYSKHPFLVVLIYLCSDYLLLNFEFIRQGLSIAVLYLFSFNFIIQKKLFKALLGVLVATLIHSTSAFMLLVIIVLNLKSRVLKVLLAIISVVSISFLLNGSLFEIISNYLSFTEFLAWKFNVYSSWTGSGNVLFIINRFGLFILFLCLLIISKGKSFLGFDYVGLAFLVIFIFVLGYSNDILSRVKYVISPLILISIVELFQVVSLKYSNGRSFLLRIIFVLLAAVPSSLELFSTYPDGTKFWVKFYPYNSVFFPVDDEEREKLYKYY